MSKKATTRADALRLARRIGCEGAHQNDEGQWMPCGSHEELTRISSAAEEKTDEPPCIGCDGKAERKKRGADQKKRWEKLRERGVMGIDTLDGGGLVSGGKSAASMNARPERVRLYDPFKAKYGLYAKALNERQQAIYDDLEKVVEEHGQFDWGTGPDGAHYVPADKNPFIKDGLVCSNCSFWKGPNKCEIVKGELEPNAICKLWVIDGDRLGEKGKKSAFDIVLEKGIGGPIGRRRVRFEPLDPKAEDGDGDGKLQDGTTAERPAVPGAQVVREGADLLDGPGVGANWRKPIRQMTRQEIGDQMKEIDELFNRWPPPSKRRAEFLAQRYEELFDEGLFRGLEMSGGGKKKKNRTSAQPIRGRNYRGRFVGATGASGRSRTGLDVFLNPRERVVKGRWHWQLEEMLDNLPPAERADIISTPKKLEDWTLKMHKKLANGVSKIDAAEVAENFRQQQRNVLQRRGINQIKDINEARALLKSDFPNLEVDDINFDTVIVNGIKTDDLTDASIGKVMAFLAFADTLDPDDPIRKRLTRLTLQPQRTVLGGASGLAAQVRPNQKGITYEMRTEGSIKTGQELLDLTRPNNPNNFVPQFNLTIKAIRELELARRDGTLDITEEEIVQLANMSIIGHELGHARHTAAWYAPINFPDDKTLQEFMGVSDSDIDYFAAAITLNARAIITALDDATRNYKNQTGLRLDENASDAIRGLVEDLAAGRKIPPDQLKEQILQLMFYAKYGDIMDGKNWADALSENDISALKQGAARISIYTGESYGMFSDAEAFPEIFAELESFKMLTGRLPDEREGLTQEEIAAIEKADDWYNNRGNNN